MVMKDTYDVWTERQTGDLFSTLEMELGAKMKMYFFSFLSEKWDRGLGRLHCFPENHLYLCP